MTSVIKFMHMQHQMNLLLIQKCCKKNTTHNFSKQCKSNLLTTNLDLMEFKELPIGTKMIMAIWVFKHQRFPDGTLNKHNARLCDHGSQQKTIGKPMLLCLVGKCSSASHCCKNPWSWIKEHWFCACISTSRLGRPILHGTPCGCKSSWCIRWELMSSCSQTSSQKQTNALWQLIVTLVFYFFCQQYKWGNNGDIRPGRCGVAAPYWGPRGTRCN